MIQYAIERNKDKIGAETIGSKIKIIGESILKKNPPEFMLVLPWHFKKEILKERRIILKMVERLSFHFQSSYYK